MLVTNHVLAGALIGAAAPYPAPAFLLGVASHLPLDTVPHWGDFGGHHQFMRVAVPDGVRVIASLRNRAPLMLEHRMGKGKIVACLTACGTAWTNWPRIPDAFVPVQLQMAAFLAQ